MSLSEDIFSSSDLGAGFENLSEAQDKEPSKNRCLRSSQEIDFRREKRPNKGIKAMFSLTLSGT